MAIPRLDKSKTYVTIFGEHEYAMKQGNKCFDAAGNFLKYEGDEPKDAPGAADEAALRAKLRAEIEAEISEEHRAKVRAGIEAARAAKEKGTG